MDGQERQHAGWTVREYDAGASGPAVLLLPGGMCTTGFYDDLAAQPLVRASSLRLVAATLPGHGGTAPLTDAGVENVARRASGLARDFDCRVVVGHSMGANVAIEMARLDEFRGPLVLLSPSFSRDDESRFLRAVDRFAGPLGSLPYRAMLRMVGVMMKQLKVTAARKAELTAEMRRNDPGSLREAVRAYLEYLDAHGTLAPGLCESGVPAWVAFGARDDVGLRDDERALLAACPTVELVEIADAGHMTLNEQPRSVADLVLQAVRSADG